MGSNQSSQVRGLGNFLQRGQAKELAAGCGSFRFPQTPSARRPTPHRPTEGAGGEFVPAYRTQVPAGALRRQMGTTARVLAECRVPGLKAAPCLVLFTLLFPLFLLSYNHCSKPAEPALDLGSYDHTPRSHVVSYPDSLSRALNDPQCRLHTLTTRPLLHGLPA
ncbi:hypothetical protein KIL84_011915 [Mauremys mutica]|uniref:Uncharacterized protein n=1 Tax=Mauremys mutica TaxID=74926 RepID=A0A9D4B1I4_9SAUR|nr:hypothetical protein KIL84_011915 [Mauremys mutica]